MLEDNKYIKDEEKVKKAETKLAYCRDIIDEIKKEFDNLDFNGMDGRDLKSMCYIFIANNPDITIEEFKEKSRGLMHDFADGLSLNKELSEEEKAERDARIKPHLDMLYEFQEKYSEFMEPKNEDDYLKALVYYTLTQTFGVKKEENKKYFENRINSLEKVKKNDMIDKFSVNYMFDLTTDFINAKVDIKNYVDMTIAGSQNNNFVDLEDAETETEIEEAKRLIAEYDREDKMLKIGLKAATLEQKDPSHLEFDVLKDLYDISKTKFTTKDLLHSTYSNTLVKLATNMILKVVGDDTNEKSVLKNDLSGGSLFNKCIYLDGRPIDYYLPEWLKNYNILGEDGKVDPNKEFDKVALTTRAQALILMNAITKGDKRIDMVRYNKYQNELGYNIEPVRFVYNQEDYEKANHGWLRRHIFRIGIKNIQRTFDRKFNDKSGQEERFNMILSDIKKKFEGTNLEIKKLDGKADGERKIVDELKNEIKIEKNTIEEINVKELHKDEIVK